MVLLFRGQVRGPIYRLQIEEENSMCDSMGIEIARINISGIFKQCSEVDFLYISKYLIVFVLKVVGCCVVSSIIRNLYIYIYLYIYIFTYMYIYISCITCLIHARVACSLFYKIPRSGYLVAELYPCRA